MIQEYVQGKIGRKIRIFILARKDNILIPKKKSIAKWRIISSGISVI